jgi:lysyl-tRNA synthetase class 2
MSDELREARLTKLAALREAGIDPFGQRFPDTQRIGEVRESFVEDEEKTVRVAGRVMANRKMGKAAFLDIRDWSGRIQIYLKKNDIGEEAWNIYTNIDMGDIVGIDGRLGKSKTGELTVFTETLTYLTKALNGLPEKFHGLKDVEVRYRKRYLDLISNPEVMETFQNRTRIVKRIRSFLDDRGYLEVETPMMQPIAGGASARPFITHHNTLDMQLFLRIAPELYLKRLLVGGMEKVYEINRNFRNEGISTQHNPEFTMMEVYHAYANLDDMMELTESLINTLAKEVIGTEQIEFDGVTLDLSMPWKREKYGDLLQEHAGIGINDFDEAKELCEKNKIKVEGRTGPQMVNDVFEKYCEPKLTGPVFVTHYPTAICPLTKECPDNPELCERFELFLTSMEMANAYTELNDPLVQRDRFEAQIEAKDEGAGELDEDFLTAQEHGMPPAGGLGIGIDRLVMVLTGNPSIREVILFPLLRTVGATEQAEEQELVAETDS